MLIIIYLTVTVLSPTLKPNGNGVTFLVAIRFFIIFLFCTNPGHNKSFKETNLIKIINKNFVFILS